MRYSMRRTRTVIGRGTTAVTVYGGPIEIDMRRHRQIVMMMRMGVSVIGDVMMMMTAGV